MAGAGRRAFRTVVAALALAPALGGCRKPPPAAPAPAPGFEDVAEQAGIGFRMNFLPNEQGARWKINLYDHGSGLAVADFDGDGHDDVYFCNQLGKNALYRNRGDGTFEDVTERAGVGLGDRVCVAATFADYDNDGRPDLYVTSTRGGNVLFHNEGNGTFKDVTKQAGVEHVGHSQTAVFFDYDNDGRLDLLLTNTGRWTTDFDAQARYYVGVPGLDPSRSPPEANVLYHNNGDGTFTDVTRKAGLGGMGWAGDVAVFDYDEDGYPDVLVTNMFGRSQLYHNNRNGTFTDVTLQVLKMTPWGGMGARAFDFNNDGRLDLFIVDMHSDMWLPFDHADDPKFEEFAARTERVKYKHWIGAQMQFDPGAREREDEAAQRLKIKYAEVVFGNTLFKNLGGGKFEEVSDAAGVETWWPWGVATGDFDNDGFEDAFVPSGMGYPFFYWRNYLLMNNGDGTFTDRSRELGVEPPARGTYQEERIAGKLATRSSRAAAVADFAGTGRLDIMVNNFNDRPYYLRNRLPAKNWVAYRLRGTRSNRDAIGAVLRAHVGKQVLTRQVSPAGGYLSQSSRTVHFGLGDRTRIDRLEIRWPAGAVQVIEDPALNVVHDLVEPGGPAGRPGGAP